MIAATPHEILAFTRRGTGKASYERLKAGLDRLQSTTIATSIRQRDARRRHRFSWINEWKERLDGSAPRVVRSNSFTPRRSSSCMTRRLSVDCFTFNAAAAREKLCVSAVNTA